MKRVKWFLLLVLLVVVTGCMSEVSDKTAKKESSGEGSQSIMEKNIAKIIEEMKKITSESGNGNVGVGIYVTGSNGDVKFYSRDYLASESTTAGVISMVAKEMSAANNKTNNVNCIVLEGNKAYTVNDIVSTSVDNITAKDAKQIVQPNKKVVDVKTNLSKRPEDRIIEVKYLSCENGLLTVDLREEDKNENEFIKYFSNANRDIQVYDENGTKVQSLKINSFKKKNDASKLYEMDIEKIYNVNEDRIVSYGKVFRTSAVYINNEEFGDIYILKGEQIKM